MEIKNKKILVLAPHTDDVDFGMGGTISRLIQDGNEIYQVAFSSASNINIHGTRNEVLIREIKAAAHSLGIRTDNLFIHDYSVRIFEENRQSILDLILYYKSKFNPDVIFCPASTDIHQDHQVIYNETVRAFKFSTILGYNLCWNQISTQNHVFFELNEVSVAKKIKACQCYISQETRAYYSEDYIKAVLVVNGVHSNKKYAESFECIRVNL